MLEDKAAVGLEGECQDKLGGNLSTGFSLFYLGVFYLLYMFYSNLSPVYCC